ncbi:MAG: glycosyltransferase family 4 protein [Candidatus Pacebacteria bacterium]|nr:glycosyltransferase family 4 protein [Candidatus Paceibacterota bacterium]
MNTMKNKRIMFLNVLFEPYIGGGAEIILKNLVKLTEQLGYSVSVVTLWDGKYLKEDTIDNINIYRLPIRNLYLPYGEKQPSLIKKRIWHLINIYNPFAEKDLKNIIQQISPDLISVHNIEGFSISCFDVITEFNIPFIQVLHDSHFICPTSMFKNNKICKKQCLSCKIMRYPHKQKSNKATAVVGVSKFILNKLLLYGYFNKVPIKKVIYNRRYPFSFSSINKVKNNNNITFGFIGTLAPNKGIELLLECFSRIKKNNWILLIAGIGSKKYENYLKNKYKNNSIIFLGKVMPEKFFLQLDVTVVPSIGEDTLPGVVFESFYFGVPVLGSKFGGIPEMIIENINGELFNPYNQNEFKYALLNFANKIDYWKNKKEEIINSSKKFFDIESWKKEWMETYKEVLKVN